MQAIIAPESCPSCGASLEWRSDLLYCNNDLCGAQVSKRLEHWGKTVKIKGLGPRTIEKLEVENLHELYDLTQEDIIEKLDYLYDKNIFFLEKESLKNLYMQRQT